MAQLDDEGELIKNPGDETRFMEARAGDHLMTQFQCETCHFRNIMGRDPLTDISAGDRELMGDLRRALLDAFWSREPPTVKGNLIEAVRGERYGDRTGMPSVTPEMGPFPLEDTSGMKAALAVLDRSLDKGKHAEFVQWDTFRKARSVVTNISQAGVSGLDDSVGAYERGRMWISKVSTHSFWFSRFMNGVHKRVGEIKRQDEPIMIDVLHSIESILETEWRRTEDPVSRKRTTEMGAWIIGGFCTGMRSEEMLLIEYTGTAKSVEKLEDPQEPHFPFVVSGRTKGNQLSGAKFGVPCVGITKGTQPGKWVKRLVNIKQAAGVRGGRLFVQQLTPSKMFEFANDFFIILERVQAQTEHIDKEMDVRETYGLMRSSRRGLTLHAKNMGIPLEDLKAFNRRRSEIKIGNSGAGRLDMPDLYAALKSLTPALLRFTRSL
jgi:hypothetical protein